MRRALNVIHYWWGGPNDGQPIELPNCTRLVVLIYTGGPSSFLYDDGPIDLPFKEEYWRCVLFRDGEGPLKHYLVPPGLVAPLSYSKIKPHKSNNNKSNNSSGLI